MRRRSLLFVGCVVVWASCKKQAPAPAATPAPVPLKKATHPAPNLDARFGGLFSIAASSTADGGSYAGEVVISSGEAHVVTWRPTNGQTRGGTGLVVDGVLGVGWGASVENRGLAAYHVNGGALDGHWASAATGSFIGSETLAGPEGLNGTYLITSATGPNDGGYTGTVGITPNGDTFDVRWALEGGASYSGVGIKRGSTLFVGWSMTDKAAGVVVYEPGDGRLVGTWARPGATALGTEVLELQ